MYLIREVDRERQGECQRIERSKEERLRDISGTNVFSVRSHSRRMKISKSDRDEYVSRRAAFIDHCRLPPRTKCETHFAPRATLMSATRLASHAAIKVMLFKRDKLLRAQL